ncbi:hypothetical protein LTR62_007915 [Meristemomyces frigidus]|uniref:Dienelactone hydrolase domain-containing protein n=1 Tax=Meristemomyces frigidus TaxID=1508187 RepID=A0AAN7YMA0_9PEZI|nr:hypothetical protein LTR62_007915 [Meristemomyces frigidus]
MDSKRTEEVGKTGEVASGDQEIAKPSGECCLQGTIHEGEPRGRIESIADMETYVVEPPKDKANGHVLLYYPDVYGHFVNGFLVMDGFANAGYTVLGPDYFRGDPVQKSRKFRGDPDFDFEAWLAKHMKFSDPAVPRWNAEVKAKYGGGGKKFACVGYCDLAKDGICTAGAFAHPAFLKESHFHNLEKPLFLSCAEIDHTFPNEYRNRAVDIMQAEKKHFQVQLFQGVEHGFALRGDPTNAYERYTKEQSLQGIVGWLDFWLAQ